MYKLIPLMLALSVVGSAAATSVYSDPTAPPRKLADAGAGDRSTEMTGRDGRVALKVQSIVISPKVRFAVINGEKYFEGDELQGMKVKAINKGFVSVLAGEEAVEYFLFNQSVKVSAND